MALKKKLNSRGASTQYILPRRSGNFSIRRLRTSFDTFIGGWFPASEFVKSCQHVIHIVSNALNEASNCQFFCHAKTSAKTELRGEWAQRYSKSEQLAASSNR
jgi:hypothetical protein